MEWERLSTDDLEQRLATSQAIRSRLAAADIEVLEELDRRQVASSDGCRSMSEWVTEKLDVAPETAKTMIRTMRRTAERPELREALASGISFDRVEALSRIPNADDLMPWADVARVRREAAKRARITSTEEMRSADDRYLVLQPSLDKAWWKLWGGLDGVTGEIVDKVLAEAADHLPEEADGVPTGWRRATALVESLISDDPPPAQVSVFVDAEDAAPTDGEAAVILESGVRVGRRALEAILCDSNLEVTARTSDGQLMTYGRQHRVAPPALKRALLDEAGFMCSADGCTSRHRLQAHHIIPWSAGGLTNPDNLVILCWFHHHVVVHERGFSIELHPDRRRVRFNRHRRGPP